MIFQHFFDRKLKITAYIIRYERTEYCLEKPCPSETNLITDIRSPKSLNSMIFRHLINFPKLSLFRRLKFILTFINRLQQTETKNRVII